jgi:ribosomal protein S18 acetylase RimI-like enzyme
MLITTKNNKQVLLRRLTFGDFDQLIEYFRGLGTDTLKRFGPHQFDKQTIMDLYNNEEKNISFIAVNQFNQNIIAYAILRKGYLEHDRVRLESYGIQVNKYSDCTFAPSVADEWQSMGIGNSLLQYILSELKLTEIKRVILWGGVQCDNSKAVNFYQKNGFKTLGEFEYNGRNYDMILDIG